MKLKLIFIKKLAGIEATTNYTLIDRKNITTEKSLNTNNQKLELKKIKSVAEITFQY